MAVVTEVAASSLVGLPLATAAAAANTSPIPLVVVVVPVVAAIVVESAAALSVASFSSALTFPAFSSSSFLSSFASAAASFMFLLPPSTSAAAAAEANFFNSSVSVLSVAVVDDDVGICFRLSGISFIIPFEEEAFSPPPFSLAAVDISVPGFIFVSISVSSVSAVAFIRSVTSPEARIDEEETCEVSSLVEERFIFIIICKLILQVLLFVLSSCRLLVTVVKDLIPKS